jgi:hypothetical protein
MLPFHVHSVLPCIAALYSSVQMQSGYALLQAAISGKAHLVQVAYSRQLAVWCSIKVDCLDTSCSVGAIMLTRQPAQ